MRNIKIRFTVSTVIAADHLQQRLTGRELSGTRARVERTAGRLGNPQRAQAANAVSGVRSNEALLRSPAD